MKLSKKIKMALGFCGFDGCFRRATIDVESRDIGLKVQVCDKCLKEKILK